MSEVQGTAATEEESGDQTVYQHHVKARQEFIQRNLTGKLLIKSTDRKWDFNRQGRVKHYLYPGVFKDTASQEWQVFIHDIKTHSGSHRHQGALAIYVLDGRGYTLVDGQRHDWKKGDLILLPLKPNGVEHQHFNTDPGAGCLWIAFIFMPMYDQVASFTEQIEVSPLYNNGR